MYSQFSKMPFRLSKVARKLAFNSSTLLRDFTEMMTMRNRHGFTRGMIKNLKKQMEEFGDMWIWFDGLENFNHSIHMFALVVYDGTNIMIFEPVMGVFYYKVDGQFYVNNMFPNCITPETSINSDLVPFALGYAWKNARYIREFICTKDHSHLVKAPDDFDFDQYQPLTLKELLFPEQIVLPNPLESIEKYEEKSIEHCKEKIVSDAININTIIDKPMEKPIDNIIEETIEESAEKPMDNIIEEVIIEKVSPKISKTRSKKSQLISEIVEEVLKTEVKTKGKKSKIIEKIEEKIE